MMSEDFSHLIEQNRFRMLCELGGGTGLLKELTFQFIGILESEIDTIRKEADLCCEGKATDEKLRQSLHSIKGAALNLGFFPVVNLTDIMREKVKNQNNCSLSGELNELSALGRDLRMFAEKL